MAHANRHDSGLPAWYYRPLFFSWAKELGHSSRRAVRNVTCGGAPNGSRRDDPAGRRRMNGGRLPATLLWRQPTMAKEVQFTPRSLRLRLPCVGISSREVGRRGMI